MNWRGAKHIELAIWAIWLGSLWMMAVLVAPGLFKWLPRPEAGLVAGRLFYMLSWYTVITSVFLLGISTWLGAVQASVRLNILMGAMLLLAVVELLWMHPTMSQMRQAMTDAAPDMLPMMKAHFGRMHAISSVLYAMKMIGGLAWGLSRYTVKSAD